MKRSIFRYEQIFIMFLEFIKISKMGLGGWIMSTFNFKKINSSFLTYSSYLCPNYTLQFGSWWNMNVFLIKKQLVEICKRAKEKWNMLWVWINSRTHRGVQRDVQVLSYVNVRIHHMLNLHGKNRHLETMWPFSKMKLVKLLC